MSGKALPEQCGKSGPAFCQWQFPNVSMTSATDAKTYAEKWSVKPGFLDPFHVAYQCIKRLKGCTYVNVKYSRNLMNKEAPNKNYPSPGLQLYLAPLNPDDPQVNRDVIEHLDNGSAENLTAVIRKYKSLQQVLLFLLKYLKERGHLIKFKYNSLEILNSVTANPRYLVNNFMTTLCEYELEFQAAVVLGEYLNFVVYCALAHDLFWVKDLLVDIWAPILIDFINVGESAADTLNDKQKREKRRLIMNKIIEAVPWDKVKNLENFKITINPGVNDGLYKRKVTEQAQQLKKLTTTPVGQPTISGGANIINFLGTLEKEDLHPVGDVDDPVEIARREAKEAEKKRKLDESKKQQEAEAENKDYSFQYDYTPEYLAKNAPHGMCRCGYDPHI